MKVAIDNLQCCNMLLLNKSSLTHALLESETHCVQMVLKIASRDSRCRAPFWNWFNETAVDFFLDKVLALLVAQLASTSSSSTVQTDSYTSPSSPARGNACRTYPPAWQHHACGLAQCKP